MHSTAKLTFDTSDRSGFGIKVSGRIADLQSRIDEEVAKGRSDKAFWKDLAEANSQEAVVQAEGEAEAESRGQKRPREEDLAPAEAMDAVSLCPRPPSISLITDCKLYIIYYVMTCIGKSPVS